MRPVCVLLVLMLGGCGMVRQSTDRAGAVDGEGVPWPEMADPADWLDEMPSRDSLAATVPGLGISFELPDKLLSLLLLGGETGLVLLDDYDEPTFLSWLGRLPDSTVHLETIDDETRAELEADYFSAWLIEYPEGPARGIAFVFSGLDNGVRDASIRRCLLKHDWLVVHLESQASYVLLEQSMRGDEASLAALGRGFADASDRHCVNAALGAEAVLAELEDRNDDLASLPVCVIGLSAGTAVAPATAVRLGERTSATVLIGGGADFFTIAHESPVTRRAWGWRLDGERLTREQIRGGSAAYLDAVEFDPYVLGPRFADAPVLVILGCHDSFVPIEQGRVLWDRMGRPDVWTFGGGHIALFFSLGRFASSIVDWIEAATDVAPGGG